MKKTRLLRGSLAIIIILSLLLTLCGCGKKPREPMEIIEEMVVGYGYNGADAAKQTEKLLKELKSADEDSAAKWAEIMDIWSGVNDALPNIDALPEGLPETDELCLVALGFQLNPDGSMKPELLERLRVLTACAKQYPNSLVVCTGGGTAAENESATEAGVMAQYLVENGIAESRIVVEDKSLTTAQNAAFTLSILEQSYPQVKSLAIISSDYHISTGTLFFEAASILGAEAGAERIHVITNAAYDAPTGSLSRTFQAGGLIELNGDRETAYDIYYDNYDIHDLSQLKKG